MDEGVQQLSPGSPGVTYYEETENGVVTTKLKLDASSISANGITQSTAPAETTDDFSTDKGWDAGWNIGKVFVKLC